MHTIGNKTSMAQDASYIINGYMIYATDPTRSSHASLAAEAAHSDLRLQKWTMSIDELGLRHQ